MPRKRKFATLREGHQAAARVRWDKYTVEQRKAAMAPAIAASPRTKKQPEAEAVA